jgi:hypothetical protein
MVSKLKDKLARTSIIEIVHSVSSSLIGFYYSVTFALGFSGISEVDSAGATAGAVSLAQM